MKVHLRTTKKHGEAVLYGRFLVDGVSKQIPLGLKVDIATFLQAYKGKTDTAVNKLMDNLRYTEKLRKIESGIKDMGKKRTVEGIRELVKAVVTDDIRQLHKQMAEILDKDVKQYLLSFVDDIESGKRLTKRGERYEPQGVAAWKFFVKVFLEYYAIDPVQTFDDITPTYVSRFQSWMGRKYMKSSVNRLTASFRKLVGSAEMDGKRTKPIPKGMFPKIAPRYDQQANEIFLTVGEVDKLYNLPLTGTREKVRDVFMLGCMTGQRWSDYHRIDETCIGVTAKGNRVIRLTQKKTKKRVVIPLLDSRAVTILRKYNYNLPEINVCTFKMALIGVAKKLAEVCPSLHEPIETVEHGQQVTRERWELVRSHTARRSCITNMFLTGRYTLEQIAVVSGHKSTTTLRRYLRQSEDENADLVAGLAGEDGLF